MDYKLLKDLLPLLEEFELGRDTHPYSRDMEGFRNWLCHRGPASYQPDIEPYWEGKENGRTPESVISTFLVHMNRYARTYSKAAIYDSAFSTQDEFIYLINLRSFGAMTKMELIKKNIQDKPTGMQIINRLIRNGWVIQADSETDKRSKIIAISAAGMDILEKQMARIREATRIVTGDLSRNEKMELIRLLTRLNDFHQPIFLKNIDSSMLLEKVKEDYLISESR